MILHDKTSNILAFYILGLKGCLNPKTKSPPKLFQSDCITLYITVHNQPT